MNKVGFIVHPSYTDVYCQDSVIREIIDECTSVRNPSARFTKAYQRGYYDGKYHLFDGNNSTLPTGLLPLVINNFEEREIEWEIRENKATFYKENIDLDCPDIITLRDYQDEATKALLSVGRGIGELATNAGKSYIAAAIINSFKVPTLVLAARQRGVTQLCSLFVDCFGEDAVADDVDKASWITVMTYNKASKRDLYEYQLLIADEVQKIPADTFFPAVMSCENAYHRFGLSGTPEGRHDNKDIYIQAATGPILHKVPQTRLIKEGYSSETNAYMIQTDGEIFFESNDWSVMEPGGIGKYALRNKAIVDIVKKAEEKELTTLIMVRLIEDHGEILLQMLKDEGIEVEFTHGRQSEQKKFSLYKDFKEGKLNTLIASGIFEDSIDIDRIDVLINAVGGKSSIATKQRLGRGLRSREGKVLTFVDFFDQHYYKLEQHAKLRKQYYEEEGLEVNLINSVDDIVFS